MAGKWKRNSVGSICKSKEEGKPDYIKMRDGKTYRLESAAFQLKSLEEAVSQGKLNEEVAESIRERINKIPSFVRFEIIELVENKS